MPRPCPSRCSSATSDGAGSGAAHDKWQLDGQGESQIAGVKAPQASALLTIVLCLAALIWRHRPASHAPLAQIDPPPNAPAAGDSAALGDSPLPARVEDTALGP